MSAISLVPQSQDLILYSGGANVLNFYIFEPDGTTAYNDDLGSWVFEIFNQKTGATIGTPAEDPASNSGANGQVKVTISASDLETMLNTQLTYQLCVGTNKYVILRGGITVESKLS